jgi:hypothetical protein
MKIKAQIKTVQCSEPLLNLIKRYSYLRFYFNQHLRQYFQPDFRRCLQHWFIFSFDYRNRTTNPFGYKL